MCARHGHIARMWLSQQKGRFRYQQRRHRPDRIHQYGIDEWSGTRAFLSFPAWDRIARPWWIRSPEARRLVGWIKLFGGRGALRATIREVPLLPAVGLLPHFPQIGRASCRERV